MIELVEYRFEHRNSLARLLNNPNVERWLLSVPSPYTLRDADHFIANSICGIDSSVEKRFAIEIEGVHIGGIGMRIRQNYHAEVGYWIGEEFWNCGYGTEALNRMLDISFDKYSLGRVSAVVFEGNIASERILSKCGFEYEGTMRKGRVKNGVPIDCKMFAKII